MSRQGMAAVWILFGSLLITLLGAPVAAADAPVPSHAVGDKVGFGTAIDIGVAVSPIIHLIQEKDRQDANITFHELDFAGTFDLWSTTEVVGASPDTYSIRTDSALGFWLDYVVNVTSTQFPKAGTYPGDTSSGRCAAPPSIPTTTETFFADVNITYLLSTTALSSWSTSGFALLEEERNTTIQAQGPLLYRNFPYFELNETTCELTVTYETIDVTLLADVGLDVQTAFTPALDLFAFPIADREVWSVGSTLTQAGNIRGTVDVRGLTPDQEAEFFEHLHHGLSEAGLSGTGLDHFPIDLEKVTLLFVANPILENGVIHEISVPANVTLQARQAEVALADGKLHPVYLISVTATGPTGGLCSMVYSPEEGFVVGFRCGIQGLPPFFELRNVSPATAEAHIAETKVRYANPAPPNPGSDQPPGEEENPPPVTPTSEPGPHYVTDLFVRPPFFGSLTIAAVALAVAGLLVRRRMRPPAGLPPMPPEAPPSGPP